MSYTESIPCEPRQPLDQCGLPFGVGERVKDVDRICVPRFGFNAGTRRVPCVRNVHGNNDPTSAGCSLTVPEQHDLSRVAWVA